MRERPEGSGHWQLRAYVGVDPVTGRERQASRTFHGSQRAAAKALAAFVAEADKGRFDETTATVGQLLDKWLEQTKVTHRPRTFYENERKIEGRIRPVLGHARLDRLSAATLDAAYRQWLEEGLSPSTVNKYHSILSAALRQAVKWGWIETAPTDRSSPPSAGQKEMVVPTPAQLADLVKSAEVRDPVLATATALAALTGARRGELVALRWSDVDLSSGTVRFSRSLTVTEGVTDIGPTKTRQVRNVALDEIGVEVLRQRWAYMQALAEEAESPLIDDPYVLSYNANGARPANPDVLTHRFAALCRAKESPALKRLRKQKPKTTTNDLAPKDRWPFRFHDLRHFSVITLIAAGVDVRTVAERHGHAQATTTLNRYAHALPERDRAAAGVLGAALSGRPT
jgi:integrase